MTWHVNFVGSKDAQKQLARTSLITVLIKQTQCLTEFLSCPSLVTLLVADVTILITDVFLIGVIN